MVMVVIVTMAIREKWLVVKHLIHRKGWHFDWVTSPQSLIHRVVRLELMVVIVRVRKECLRIRRDCYFIMMFIVVMGSTLPRDLVNFDSLVRLEKKLLNDQFFLLVVVVRVCHHLLQLNLSLAFCHPHFHFRWMMSYLNYQSCRHRLNRPSFSYASFSSSWLLPLCCLLKFLLSLTYNSLVRLAHYDS